MAQEMQQWTPGVELMQQLAADSYHVEPRGFFVNGQPRGLAVYKREGLTLARRDAVEVCEGEWTQGKPITWYVSPEETKEDEK